MLFHPARFVMAACGTGIPKSVEWNLKAEAASGLSFTASNAARAADFTMNFRTALFHTSITRLKLFRVCLMVSVLRMTLNVKIIHVPIQCFCGWSGSAWTSSVLKDFFAEPCIKCHASRKAFPMTAHHYLKQHEKTQNAGSNRLSAPFITAAAGWFRSPGVYNAPTFHSLSKPNAV